MIKAEKQVKTLTKQTHNSDRKAVVGVPAGQEYVDPYLFETGYFASREEYDELSRTAKVKPRARA